MKKLALVLVLTAAVAIVLLAAQLNYKMAINSAKNSEGSDMAIENAMYQYGFNIDATDCSEPTLLTKIQALYK